MKRLEYPNPQAGALNPQKQSTGSKTTRPNRRRCQSYNRFPSLNRGGIHILLPPPLPNPPTPPLPSPPTPAPLNPQTPNQPIRPIPPPTQQTHQQSTHSTSPAPPHSQTSTPRPRISSKTYTQLTSPPSPAPLLPSPGWLLYPPPALQRIWRVLIPPPRLPSPHQVCVSTLKANFYLQGYQEPCRVIGDSTTTPTLQRRGVTRSLSWRG